MHRKKSTHPTSPQAATISSFFPRPLFFSLPFSFHRPPHRRPTKKKREAPDIFIEASLSLSRLFVGLDLSLLCLFLFWRPRRDPAKNPHWLVPLPLFPTPSLFFLFLFVSLRVGPPSSFFFSCRPLVVAHFFFLSSWSLALQSDLSLSSPSLLLWHPFADPLSKILIGPSL